MRWMLLVAMTMAGCATVRPQDLDAWRGARLTELELHPLFSSMPRTVTPVSDGSELWSYSNCRAVAQPIVCNKVGEATICTGGAQGQACCNNQFVVRGGMVEGYRAVGRCYTNCSVRPASRSCS